MPEGSGSTRAGSGAGFWPTVIGSAAIGSKGASPSASGAGSTDRLGVVFSGRGGTVGGVLPIGTNSDPLRARKLQGGPLGPMTGPA